MRILLFFVLALFVTSACSRKSGCPEATHASKVFEKDAKKKTRKN